MREEAWIRENTQIYVQKYLLASFKEIKVSEQMTAHVCELTKQR